MESKKKAAIQPVGFEPTLQLSSRMWE